ncbi:cytochrome c oxidase assembly protein [Bacillus sp. DTU_2020_1000418_1_SI_GHA_SEK_038]|uniref:cytochrome c oxidase assembly protein n=1 Tax=Bacillus sp. DTU_2020_1000418_1_SI_GHA_SEK_038 TaxID=3077585 RepID=UPI0028EEF24A|nr:cytochrome c oxidase assembly protein [Bacillus sp. DTU_2020_1000418_1_SI_GHA_SEK_038]WNS73945.1 cytochrome c oxidase assembly protein [Bacillus sp. DTU_2020_1000418_1_SI_GHA_SEK_038]
MNNNHIHHFSGNSFGPVLLLLLIIALIIYILAVVISNRRYKRWPLYRTAFWISGVICIAAAAVGPVANHADFTAHMLGHLLIGMLAPLLLALAAPMTLFLRILNVKFARRLSRILKSLPVKVVSNPAVASLLNVGGLWVLYTTELYGAMQKNMILHVLIHIHVFLAGYLFTISMIYIDPTPHRTSFVYRAIIFVIALAGHGILSKYIYIHPPSNVPLEQAEIGGMLMYYGGDAVDIIIIFILCLQWYRASRPRTAVHESVSL